MPSFPSLSDDDVRDVAAFTQTLTKPAPAEDHALDDAELTSAAGLFEQNCAACHGERDTGDGALAPIAPRPPTDFRRVQPSTEMAFNAISNGVAGTTMPSWKAKFAGPQRRLLAAYVRSLHPAEEGE
jgi:high-affinity iron transporter